MGLNRTLLEQQSGKAKQIVKAVDEWNNGRYIVRRYSRSSIRNGRCIPKVKEILKYFTQLMLIFFCFERVLAQEFYTKAAEESKIKPREGVLNKEHLDVKEAIAIQEKYTRDLMQQPEIFATGVTVDKNGAPIFQISIDKESPKAKMILDTLLKRFKDIRAIISLDKRLKPL